MLVLRVAQRCVTSLGTLLFSRMQAPDGSDWTVARSTEWTMPLALATSCAEACAESALFPTRLHAKSEPSVTISSQVHLQLAQPASARVQRSARVFKYFIQNHEYHGLYGIQTQEYYGAIVFKLKNTMAP